VNADASIVNNVLVEVADSMERRSPQAKNLFPFARDSRASIPLQSSTNPSVVLEEI
jgi:hypothetical protein